MSCVEEAGRFGAASVGRREQGRGRRGPAARRRERAGEGAERRREGAEERERRKERGEGDGADKWAPLPRGVHVSKTGPQNSPMVKNKRFS